MTIFNNMLQNGRGILSNPDMLLAMAGPLISGQTAGQQFGGMFQAAGGLRAQQREQMQAEQQKNQTLQYLQAKHPELAAMVASGMPVAEAWGAALKAQMPQANNMLTDDIKEYEYAKNNGFGGTFGDWQTYKSSNGAAKVGLNPVLLQGAEGDYIYGQPTADGKIVQSQVPEGYRPVSPFDKRFQEQWGSAEGKARGEAGGSYESISAKLPGLLSVTDKLKDLSEKATYTYAGQARDFVGRQLGVTTDGAQARTEYEAIVSNQILPLLRDTFGAAFTVKEGETLRATLGDPDKSPSEKQAVIDAFVAQKIRDMEALRVQSGRGNIAPQAAPQQQPSGNTTSSGVKWSIE